MHICRIHLAKVPEIMLPNKLLTSNVHGLEENANQNKHLNCFNFEVL